MKILMLINEFPPTGESGVQRPLKFVKYLERNGWQTYVVTPKKPPKSVLDYSLLEEVPNRAKIYRTFSLGIGAKQEKEIENLRYNVTKKDSGLKKLIWTGIKFINDLILPLDKQIGWVPFAYFRAVKLIKKYEIKNVYITGFPFSAFLIGILLKKKFGASIFWVADYRDPWQFEAKIDDNVFPFRKRIMKKWDEKTLKTADHIVFNTGSTEDTYLTHYPFLQNKATTITNGYDEDDFLRITPHKFEKFTIFYMGKIYASKRSPASFLQVLQSFGKDIEFVHIGTYTKEFGDYIDKHGITCYKYMGYKSHHEALGMALGADINLNLTNNDPDSRLVVSGKSYELFRIGKPILALGPEDTVIEKIITENNLGVCGILEDEASMRAALTEILAKRDSFARGTKLTEFSREHLTQKLMAIYRQGEK